MGVCIINNSQNEYLKTDTHNYSNEGNVVGADNLNYQVQGRTGKVYYVHLEFSDETNNIGEEIRDSLKKKIIQSKLGSIQVGSSELQSHTNEGRSEF